MSLMTRFNRLMDKEGDAGGGGGGGGADQHVVPESYTFAQIDGKDVDANIAKEVSEYAKANKFSQAQAQAFLTRELSTRASNKTPDTYTFAKIKQTTKVDGKDVESEVDAPADIAKEISEYAKANGLTQKQAQAMMNRELQLIADAGVADKDAQAKGLATLKQKWQSEAKADKDFGGEGGAKFDENLGIAKRALAKFFPEIEKDADKHPFLDHPQVLKGLLNIGKLLSPDGDFVAGKGSDAPRDAAKVLYPNMA